MPGPVYYLPLGNTAEDSRHRLPAAIARLGAALELGAGPAGSWAVKVHLGGPNRPPAVDPAWANAVAAELGVAGADSFFFDTLSITTPGLDTVAGHLDLARTKGFAPGGAVLPYVVADADDRGAPVVVPLPADSALTSHTVAGGLRNAANLCVLTPVRPHPHVGLRGALTTLGVGLTDRAGKIALHQDIRPRVDTPLCAGCGVCMTVCLFDAIKLNGGRAFIDHTLCTGCGECMNVCFMAGISPAEAQGIPLFQQKVADAALASRDRIAGPDRARQVYFNFLVRLDRQQGGARARKRDRLGDVGVLAARDPVALDQATTDLITDRMAGQLAAWSGFNQLPGALLARAEAIGLGETAYRLVTV